MGDGDGVGWDGMGWDEMGWDGMVVHWVRSTAEDGLGAKGR